jgi:cytochrome c biogenesis protein CcmG/thiol:disulfide interchange protein DsbE
MDGGRPLRASKDCVVGAEVRPTYAILGAVFVACAEQAPHIPGAVGAPVPVYGAVTMQGDSVELARMKGNVVLLNVWATWCIPCRREVHELQALHQQYESKGLRVWGVSVDAGEAERDVADFAQDFHMTYTILRDPAERVLSTFRIQGVPASYLIDREGIVRWRTLGPFKASDAALQSALQQALNQST